MGLAAEVENTKREFVHLRHAAAKITHVPYSLKLARAKTSPRHVLRSFMLTFARHHVCPSQLIARLNLQERVVATERNRHVPRPHPGHLQRPFHPRRLETPFSRQVGPLDKGRPRASALQRFRCQHARRRLSSLRFVSIRRAQANIVADRTRRRRAISHTRREFLRFFFVRGASCARRRRVGSLISPASLQFLFRCVDVFLDGTWRGGFQRLFALRFRRGRNLRCRQLLDGDTSVMQRRSWGYFVRRPCGRHRTAGLLAPLSFCPFSCSLPSPNLLKQAYSMRPAVTALGVFDSAQRLVCD